MYVKKINNILFFVVLLTKSGKIRGRIIKKISLTGKIRPVNCSKQQSTDIFHFDKSYVYFWQFFLTSFAIKLAFFLSYIS
jgi:hypothetical protein